MHVAQSYFKPLNDWIKKSYKFNVVQFYICCMKNWVHLALSYSYKSFIDETVLQI